MLTPLSKNRLILDNNYAHRISSVPKLVMWYDSHVGHVESASGGTVLVGVRII